MRRSQLTPPEPLETLYDVTGGTPFPLPTELAAFYGELRFPQRSTRPYVVANFAETLDGIVAFGGPGKAGGDAITGSNGADRALMGLLRASADAVVVGAGTLRSVPRHLWTGGHIFPALAPAFQEFRRSRGKTAEPVNAVVTGSGNLDLSLPVFSSGRVPAAVFTSEEGARRLRSQPIPPSLSIVPLAGSGTLSAARIVADLDRRGASDLVLVEGGPHLMGDFLDEGILDELFLTVAPQVGGRSEGEARLGLVEGRMFGPNRPLWGSLRSVRRGGDHLFLRFAFSPPKEAGGDTKGRTPTTTGS